MHFDTKKYIKNSKMRVILNKEDMISYYHIKKKEKKNIGMPQNWAEIGQNEKNW